MSTQAPTRNGSYADAAGVRTYYEVTGSGEPLLLLHGGMCTLETFDGLVPGLAAGHRVVAPERRGHGRTPDVEGPITYELMAADTIAFMAATGLESADLVGWSDGAAIALLVALERPDLIRRLVLIGQFAGLDGMSPQMQGVTLTTEMLPPFLRRLHAAVSPDGPERFDSVFERLGPAWTSFDVPLAELARVTAPTLVMMGEEDLLTVAHAEAMRRALPDGHLAVVPNATHGLPMETPDLTARLILDFLA
jgi:pimeloyl-ACP methyl ester carboxylesterase